jgi:hypothetical protein
MEKTTLRQMIAGGGRGGFAKALLAFYDNITVRTLMEAYSVADSKNREALQKCFPEVDYLHGVWYNATQEQQDQLEKLFVVNNHKPDQAKVREVFTGLQQLDTKDYPQNLHKISIR